MSRKISSGGADLAWFKSSYSSSSEGDSCVELATEPGTVRDPLFEMDGKRSSQSCRSAVGGEGL